MPNPIIILGAGASHDYISRADQTKTDQWIPPVTNDLFNPQKFLAIINQFPIMHPLTANVVASVRNGRNLEDSLVTIKSRAAKNSDIQKELIALEFYLHKLFTTITAEFAGQPNNNYDALWWHINDYIQRTGEEVTVLTFNYDLLFEQSIPQQFKKINDYISGNLKVIKLHGSCNWVYVLPGFDIRTEDADANKYDSYSWLMNDPYYLTRGENIIPKKDKQIYISQNYSHVDGKFKKFFYPALAVPLTGKDEFICPDEHIEVVKQAFAKTDRLLIIGWKAGEAKLLEIMKNSTKNRIAVTVVSRTGKSVKEIEDKIGAIGSVTFKTGVAGFGAFNGSDNLRDFFIEKVSATDPI